MNHRLIGGKPCKYWLSAGVGRQLKKTSKDEMKRPTDKQSVSLLVKSPSFADAVCVCVCVFSGMWSFSVSELAIPGAEIGRISAGDADLGENAKLEYTILEGESGDTFNVTGLNEEAVITLSKVRNTAETGQRSHGS